MFAWLKRRPKSKFKIRILENNGTLHDGFANRVFDGWRICTTAGILDAYGVDGKFPLGNPWGWVRWEFVEQPTEN